MNYSFKNSVLHLILCFLVLCSALISWSPSAVAASTCDEMVITDLRYASIVHAPMNCTIIRIDTNLGISGYGEVRDAAAPELALQLKKYILGRNPCQVEDIFASIRKYGGPGRQGGGVSAVEMALWDIKGKALGVPVHKLLGTTLRDRFPMYADTPEIWGDERFHADGRPNGIAVGTRLMERRRQGYAWLKFDFGIHLLENTADAFVRRQRPELGDAPHVELSQKGIDTLVAFVAEVRSVVGEDIPLAADHFGPITEGTAIRLAQAIGPYHLAWLEDVVPWTEAASLRNIAAASETPILTGEDIFGLDGFQKLLEMQAIDYIQPDIATAGGVLETKHIADEAFKKGVPMILHYAGTPIGFAASLQVAAVAKNFVAIENHSIDVPWWMDLVKPTAKPLLDSGTAVLPDAPGLGVEPSEEIIRAHIGSGGYFEPTPEWND